MNCVVYVVYPGLFQDCAAFMGLLGGCLPLVDLVLLFGLLLVLDLGCVWLFAFF